MKLLSAPASPFARKVRIVLAEKRIECGIDWRAECPGLARHYDKLMERPAFAGTVPATQ